MSRFIAAAFLLVATAAFAAANQVAVPVMTGTINGATYRTTVDIRSGSSTGCTFELRRSDGATFRSTDHVDAGTPKLFEAFASEFQPLATIVRVSCTDAAEVYSRIHESADGGITFNDGPLYRAADVRTLTAGQTFSTPITGDFIVAEVSGAPVCVIAKLTATDSGRVLDRVYELAPFAQHSVGIAAALRALGPVRGTFLVQGEGNVIVLRAEAETSTTANVASRAPAEVRSRLDAQVADAANPAVRTPPVPRQLLVSPIKAAPFQEPATGLVLMRERWYDPTVGTFLTPDPMSYVDSSNLYAAFAGDPVNRRDPTGTVIQFQGSQPEQHLGYKDVMGWIDDAEAQRFLRFNRATRRIDIVGMTDDAFISRFAGTPAGRLGEMIKSPRVLKIWAVTEDTPRHVTFDSLNGVEEVRWRLKKAGGGWFTGTRDGSIVLYDRARLPAPTMMSDNRTPNVLQTPETLIAHEVGGHAYADMIGIAFDTGVITVSNDAFFGVSSGEAAGLYSENLYRKAHGLPPRKKYKILGGDWEPPDDIAQWFRDFATGNERPTPGYPNVFEKP